MRFCLQGSQLWLISGLWSIVGCCCRVCVYGQSPHAQWLLTMELPAVSVSAGYLVYTSHGDFLLTEDNVWGLRISDTERHSRAWEGIKAGSGGKALQSFTGHPVRHPNEMFRCAAEPFLHNRKNPKKSLPDRV